MIAHKYMNKQANSQPYICTDTSDHPLASKNKGLSKQQNRYGTPVTISKRHNLHELTLSSSPIISLSFDSYGGHYGNWTRHSE